MRIKNSKIAMVLCPSWRNIPPIAPAYIKGAVTDKKIDCFDFNLKFLKKNTSNHKKCLSSNIEYIRPFMTNQPDFKDFENACELFRKKYSDFINECVNEIKNYGIIGFSLYQETILVSTVIARILRQEHGVLTIAGGPSINMDDQVFLKYLLGSAFDIAVMGIAENFVPALLDNIINNENLHDIPNLAFRDSDNNIIYTDRKEPDFSKFSPPNYDDFNLDDYNYDNDDLVHIYTVTGCLGRCEFCTIHEFYPKYKTKSLENIKKEILLLKNKYNKNKFYLSDGMFLGSKEKALELFNFAIENDIKLSMQIRMMPYWNDEELVNKASQCVFFFQVGFESASPNVRKAMGKMVNHKQTIDIFNLFYKYKLPLYVNIIIGYPNETEEDFQYTYDFLEKYVQEKNVIGVGLNGFFIPNNFPKDKYNITLDNKGYWKSETVNISERYSRIKKLCNLAEKYGHNHYWMYYHDTVEGIPLDDSADLIKEFSVKTNIKDFIKKNKNKKICFYGAGKFAEQIVKTTDLSKLNIIGFIDKDSSKKGQKIGKYEIYSVDDLEQLKPDILVLTVLQKQYVLPYIENLIVEKNLEFDVVYNIF